MRALALTALAAVAALTACGGGSDVRLPEGRVLLGIGDSYVAGVQLSSQGVVKPPASWFEQVASRTQRAPVNLGRAGSLSRDAVGVAARVDPGPDDVVVIGTGTNDMRTYGEDPGRLAAYGERLSAVVDELAGGPCVVVLPVLPVVVYALYPPGDRGSQAAVAAYERVAAEVATRTGARFADIATGWDPTRMLAQDGAHPNQLGESAIAESVLRAVAGCPSG